MAINLIYIFIKNSHSQNWLKTPLHDFLRLAIHKNFSIILFIIFLSFSTLAKAQSTQMNYKIMRGGNDIGRLQLEKKIVGNKSNLMLTSEIKTYLLFLITVLVKESAIFENGKLIYSSQFRKINGTTKMDKQTLHVEDKYVVTENGKKEKLKLPLIDYNVLSLYFAEPITVKSVYSDKQQCYINLIKMNDGGYKIKFADGNTNNFYYQNGVCTKVKINNPFYSIEIIHQP